MRNVFFLSLIFFSVIIYFIPKQQTGLFNGTSATPKSEYWDNGQLRASGMVIGFEKTGTWEFFNREGKLEKRVVFEKGEIISVTQHNTQ